MGARPLNRPAILAPCPGRKRTPGSPRSRSPRRPGFLPPRSGAGAASASSQPQRSRSWAAAAVSPAGRSTRRNRPGGSSTCSTGGGRLMRSAQRSSAGSFNLLHLGMSARLKGSAMARASHNLCGGRLRHRFYGFASRLFILCVAIRIGHVSDHRGLLRPAS